MGFLKWKENGVEVEGWICPQCGLTLYKEDNPALYKKMGVIE